MECGKNNGACSCIEGYAGVKCQKCMPHVVGDKCDTCKPSFFDFPSCQEGLSWKTTNLFLKLKTILLHISECKCDPEGSTTLDCERINGDCSCKERVTGIKCDECMPNYFNFPFCQGMSQQNIFLKANLTYFSYFRVCM